MNPGNIHFVIGDTQARPGIPLDYLRWIGQYAVDQLAGRPNVTLIHAGDHWDLPSLSAYDRGKAEIEGKRFVKDMRAGDDGWQALNEPLVKYNRTHRVKWRPKKKFKKGNHENRRERHMEENPQLVGSLQDFNTLDWEVAEFLEPETIDGVTYAHYFYNPMTGRPYAGDNINLRLKNIGHSFTQGHQQGRQYGSRPVGARSHHGLVLGSSYIHDEKYLGPQTKKYWRGIAVCHRVQYGEYDPMFVSLGYLCERYEKKTLKRYMKENGLL